MNVQIETTNVCTAKCVFCPYKDTYALHGAGTMSDEIFDEIVRQMVESKLEFGKIPVYSQGEPLVDKKIFDRMKKLATSGIKYKRLELSTNCSLLNDENTEKMFEVARMTHLEVLLSFHGTSKEEHDRLMGISYDICMRNAENFLKKAERQPVNIKMSCAVLHGGVPEFWAKKFKELGLRKRPFIKLYEPNNRAGHVDEKYAKKVRQDNGNCKRLTDWLHFDWKGDIVLCCNAYNSEAAFGNVRINNAFELQKKIREKAIARMRSEPNFACNRCDRKYV